MGRRAWGLLVLLSILLLGLGASAATAATRQQVSMTVLTTFDGEPAAFVSTLEGCESGLVFDGPANLAFTPALGVFAGFKVFECDGDESGFVVRLNAQFGPAGATGTWSIVDGWGDFARLRGSGKLVGTPFPDGSGITDAYVGTVLSV